jgi:hypothetical protein
MWRLTAAVLLVVLAVGLLVVGYGGWRELRATDDRVARLTEELEAMHQTQRELLAKQDESQVLEITGRAYLGDPADPAVGATILICRLPETDERSGLVKVRTLTTDALGHFDSGPLPPGDYYAVAKLLHPPEIEPSNTYYTQSRPYYLYPGAARGDPAELDVKLHYGIVEFEASRSLPFLVSRESKAGEDATLAARNPNRQGERAAIVLEANLQPAALRTIPWAPTRAEPPQWPIIGALHERTSWKGASADFPFRVIVPAGSYRTSVQIFSVAASNNRETGRGGALDEKTSILANAHTNAERRAEGETLGEIEIVEGQTTRVGFDVPEDYEGQLRQLMSDDPAWHSPFTYRPGGERQWKGNDFIRKQPLKLTIAPAPDL